jgi:hypothetical protein
LVGGARRVRRCEDCNESDAHTHESYTTDIRRTPH